jgi:hypothetical protein
MARNQNQAGIKTDTDLQNKLAAFRKTTVKHKRLMEARELLLSYLFDDAEEGVICVIGPTGAGKTTLLKQCIADVLAHEASEMENDHGYIPIAYVEARAPERGNFDWATLYRDSLIALHEPLVDRKVLPKAELSKFSQPGSGPPISRTVTQYRIALDNALKYRRTKIILIDEGQTLLKVSSARLASDQMDTIKSRASLTGVKHVLIGTYELLNTGDLSGQLSRRRRNIHLPRYNCDEPDDVAEFASIIHTFQSNLPIPCVNDLTKSFEFMYAKSVGCTGILKTWLNVTENWAAKRGLSKITLKDLEKNALPNRDLMRMLSELREGEKQLSGPSDSALMAELGLSTVHRKNSDEQIVSARKKADLRPGQRNPTRDPIGEVVNA